MAVAVREQLQASSLVSPIILVTGAGTQVDDVLVAVHFTAFYSAADMQAPSVVSGVGTWTLIATARNDSSNAPHIKAWWAPVTSAGAKSVSFNHAQADPPNNAFLLVLSGANMTTPVSGSGVLNDAFDTAQVAPSVTGEDGGLLACGWVCDDLVNYTAPGSMTGSETENTFNTALGAYELLTATGATGSRTATSSAAKTHSAISVGIAPTGGTTQVTSDHDFRWRSATTVQSDLDARWRVANVITANHDFRWRTATLAASNHDFRWAVATRVTSDHDLRWRAATRVTSDHDLRWLVDNTVTSDHDFRWITASGGTSVVTSDLDLRWRSLTRVESDHSLPWRVTTRVTSDHDLRWGVRIVVTSDHDMRWRVWTGVVSDHEFRWAILTRVQGDHTFRWIVLSDIVLVPDVYVSLAVPVSHVDLKAPVSVVDLSDEVREVTL